MPAMKRKLRAVRDVPEEESDSSGSEEPNFEEDDEEIDDELAFTAEDRGKYSWFDDEDDDGDGEDEQMNDEEEDEEAVEDGESDDGEELGAVDDWLEEEADTDEEANDDAAANANVDETVHRDMLQSLVGERRKVRRSVVLTEPVGEGEFNVAATRDGGASLSVADLLAATSAASAKGASKQLRQMAAKGHTLTAALPKLIKERQERKAGYVEASAQATKWQPLVKANREAATLRLTTERDIPRVSTAAGLASKHEAATDFEREVAELLKAAGQQDLASVSKAEESLATKTMTVEELRKRQDAMAKNHALLFYAEQKARRLKKIKSKAFHRHEKKRQRAVAANGVTEEHQTQDEMQRAAEEAEFERAKERLTLKHKNSSRWARRALKRGAHLLEDSTKEAIHEQLRLGREIREKARTMRDPTDGADSDASTSASDGSDNDDEGAGGPALSTREKVEVMEMLREGGGAQLDGLLPDKGLFSLPFMRRAMKKQSQAVAVEAEELVRELDSLPVADSAAGVLEGGFGASAAASHASGRVQFGQGPAASTRSAPAPNVDADDLGSDEDEDAQARVERVQAAAEAASRMDAALNDRDAADPAPSRSGGGGEGRPGRAAEQKAPGRVIEVGVAGAPRAKRGSGAAAASLPAHVVATKAKRKAPPPRKSLEGGADVLPDAETAHVQLGGASRPAAGPPSSTAAPRGDKASADAGMPPAAAANGLEGNEAAIMAAFAGDDVVAEFGKDKAAQVQESVEHVEEPSALPGWGTWSNAKREPRWLREKREQAEAEKRRLLAARADSKAKGVIISEKWDKKAAKYSTPTLPFPYAQKEVYERSMRVPLGRDTNTEASFRELTRPAVIKQTGSIIAPLRLSKTTLEASRDKKRSGDSIMVISGGKVTRNKKH